MKSYEFIQAAANMLSALAQAGKSDDSAQPNSAVMVQVEPEYDDKTEKTGVLVPPLQAKIELLKKAVNVDSIYDKTGEDSDMTGYGADNEDDELDQIRKLSGINPVVTDEAASDEPLDV
jgi:hypothetical protein